MSRSYRSRLTRCALALTLLAVTIGALATSASAATKTFSLNITPSSAGAGTTPGYSATITNESGGTLDSVTLFPPAGFTLLPPGGTFSDLGLGNGSSTTVKFSARTPCAADGSYSWSANGMGANNQRYTLNTLTSSRATTVTGKCSLTFSRVGSGEQGALLSTVDYKALGDPGAAAVTVTLWDSNSAVTKSADGDNVQLALPANPSALPASAASSALSDGVATFSSLKVTQSSLAYILTASVNANITDGTSNTFKIWDKDIKCQAATPCGQSYKAGDLTTEPNATFDSSDGLLISYGVQDALCDSAAYNSATHLPTVVTVDSEGGQFTSNWTIKFSVSKQYDQAQSQNGASFYQICLASTAPFKTLEGGDAAPVDLGGVTYYVGLVQNAQQCVDPAPCILSKTKTKTGVVIIVLRLEAGDPWTH